MRARLKPEVWDVWQYKDRSSPRPLWVLNVTAMRDGVLQLWPGWPSIPKTGAKEMTIGDWLVRAPGGIEHETDADFRRDYEMVE
jgi:hypothetical protein